jgi:hypothetical protein
LVSGATKTVRKYESENIGVLLTPDARQDISKCKGYWAVDNSCYSGFTPSKYFSVLDYIGQQDRSKLAFITIPDVVADVDKTLEQFSLWHPVLSNRYPDYPWAIVLQDGITEGQVPWDKIAAVFIGGTTEWKLGIEAARLAKIAKGKGKWVHMGRVNTEQRIQYAEAIGCDSIDGSSFSMFANTHIPWAMAKLENPQQSFNEVFI